MSTEQNASTREADAEATLSANGRVVRSPLIVVGMHRSGTSFAASLLHAAGLDMGSRLMPAARGNERGHFENLDFVDFHMRELRLTGYDDAGWAAQHSIALSDEAAEEARNIIENNARISAWGWKDPRTTLFLDFWSSVVPQATYLFVYREPSEVIDSLYRRGDESIQLSPELAARAYIAHNGIMLRHAREHRGRSILANVSAIARDPQKFLVRLSEKLGIDLNMQASSPFERELMRAIHPNTPHARLLREIVPDIAELYATLEREADIPSQADDDKSASPRKMKDAFFSGWLHDSKLEGEFAEQATTLQATREALAAAEASNEQRGAYLEEAERLIAVERGESQKLREERDGLQQRLERTTRAFIAQTEELIAATRAESDRVALLIATVQSSSFWKLKRGMNRVFRYFVRR